MKQADIERMACEADEATHAPFAGAGGNYAVFKLTEAALAHFAAAIRKEALAEAQALVLDDAWAMTFQTLGQYRTALARALSDQAPS